MLFRIKFQNFIVTWKEKEKKVGFFFVGSPHVLVLRIDSCLCVQESNANTLIPIL